MRVNWAAVLASLDNIFRVIWLLRAPLAISAAVVVILSQTGQIIEIYVNLAQDYISDDPAARKSAALQVALALGSAAALGLILWSIARDLTYTEARHALTARNAQGVLLRNLPGVFGIVVFIGAIQGLQSAPADCLISADVAQSVLKPAQRIPVEQTLSEIASIKNLLAGQPELLNALTQIFPPATAEVLNRACSLSSPLKSAVHISFGVALAVLLIILWRANTKLERFAATPFTVFGLAGGVTITLLALIFGGLAAAQSYNAGTAGGFDFTQIPRATGVIFIINLFFIIIAFLFSWMTRVYDRHGLPLLTIFLVCGVAFSLFNLNDNHRVQTVEITGGAIGEEKKTALRRVQQRAAPANAPASSLPHNGLPILNKAFDDWFASRPERIKQKFRAAGKPYPVYVVAAEGGGLYAATLSALTLARLYDRCPDIRHHIFAISGVSGGGLGAGLIASLLIADKDRLQAEAGCDFNLDKRQSFAALSGQGPEGVLEGRVRQFLSNDFLSPLIASALFPDMAQRVLPVAIGAFDRARAFEASLEQSFAATLKLTKEQDGAGNPMRRSFLKAWAPQGPAPMLILNTTTVETGEKLILAPITDRLPGPQLDETRVTNADYPSAYTDALGYGRDIRLSTAISLSARFPIIMPAGLLRLRDSACVAQIEAKCNADSGNEVSAQCRNKAQDDCTVRLVDGGYFENSGVSAAQGVIRDLRFTQLTKDEVCNSPGAEPGAPPSADRLATDCIGFELLALYEQYTSAKQREGLGELLSPLRALYRTRIPRGADAIRNATEKGIPATRIDISHDHFRMALGWQFASITQELIDAQIGRPESCPGGLLNAQLNEAVLGAVAAARDDKDAPKISESTASLVRVLGSNSCSMCKVLQTLNGVDPFAAPGFPCKQNPAAQAQAPLN